jgi:hypothetical protein
MNYYNTNLIELLNSADKIHEILNDENSNITIKELNDHNLNIQLMIKNLQSITKRLSDINNIVVKKIKRKIAEKNNKRDPNNHQYKFIDPYPNIYSNINLIYDTSNKHNLLCNNILVINNLNKLDNNLLLPIREVSNETEIPNSFIYYITKYKQYAININGNIIRGNLGNILNYEDHNTINCKYGKECKNISKCTYYHDPVDYIENKLEVKNNTRNYSNSNWIYNRINKVKIFKQYNYRLVGNGINLKEDIENLDEKLLIQEINNRRNQLIHDLLIYNILQINLQQRYN